MTHIHTIPVDASLTADAAWREVCIFGHRVTFTGGETWANVNCDAEECAGIEPAEVVEDAPIGCEFDHPHPDQPCGRWVVNGVTRCTHCGNFDGSPECAAAGCWEPFTEADLDGLYLEAWGLGDNA